MDDALSVQLKPGRVVVVGGMLIRSNNKSVEITVEPANRELKARIASSDCGVVCLTTEPRGGKTKQR